jgi:hypothetical protein
MSRAWLCRKGRFWRFWGCRQEGGNCIWRVWLWGRCRQSNAAHLHPVGLVGPETRTKHTLSFSSLLSRAELTREQFRAQRAEHPNFFNIFYFNLIYINRRGSQRKEPTAVGHGGSTPNRRGSRSRR